MAYNNLSIYPNGTLPATADFPFGQPRNATSDVTNDGWPNDELKLSDYEAVFQALLDRANITPSGLGDTVQQSDYMNAIFKLMGVVVAIPSDMNVLTGLRSGQLVRSIGYQTATDNISRTYRIASTSSVPAPTSNDVVLTGINLGLTAVFIGEVAAKPTIYNIVVGTNFSENTPLRLQVKDNIAVWTGSVVVDTTPAAIMTGIIPSALQIKGYPGGNVILNMMCRVKVLATGAVIEKAFRVSQTVLLYEDTFALSVGDIVYFDGLTYIVDVT